MEKEEASCDHDLLPVVDPVLFAFSFIIAVILFSVRERPHDVFCPCITRVFHVYWIRSRVEYTWICNHTCIQRGNTSNTCTKNLCGRSLILPVMIMR